MVRKRAVVVLTLSTLLIGGFSGSFGRAEPTGSYRPDLTASAFACWPLPGGVNFDFPSQVRSDGDVVRGGLQRRRLVMQYDLMSANETLEQIRQAFISAGFTPSKAPPEVGGLHLTKPGVGRVAVVATPLEGVFADSIVRGTIVLDLPASEPTSQDPECSQPYSTKRFPADWEQAS